MPTSLYGFARACGHGLIRKDSGERLKRYGTSRGERRILIILALKLSPRLKSFVGGARIAFLTLTVAARYQSAAEARPATIDDQVKAVCRLGNISGRPFLYGMQLSLW